VRDVTWGSKEKQKLLQPDAAIASGSSCIYKCFDKWQEIKMKLSSPSLSRKRTKGGRHMKLFEKKIWE